MAARARRSRSIALALALLRRGLEADRETLLSLVGRWALPSGGAFRVREVDVPARLARCTAGARLWVVRADDLLELRRRRDLRWLGR